MYSEQLFRYFADNFNFAFVISINVVAYLFIQFISLITKREVAKVIKVMVTILASIMLYFLYGAITDISKEVLINSSIIAPVSWDWVIKPLCKWIKIDYKQEESS